MSVLLMAGRPTERSRSAALLERVGQPLAQRGVAVERLRIRGDDLSLKPGVEVVALVKATGVSLAKI